jgi:hypothetical protein
VSVQTGKAIFRVNAKERTSQMDMYHILFIGRKFICSVSSLGGCDKRLPCAEREPTLPVVDVTLHLDLCYFSYDPIHEVR